MAVSMPAPAPVPRPKRRRRSIWLMLFVLLFLLSGTALAAYRAGQASGDTRPFDLIRLRAALDWPSDRSVPGEDFWVAGYYVDYDRTSLDMVAEQAHNMDQVIIFGYGFDRQGNVMGSDQSIVKGATGQAKRVLLFGNLTNGAFDEETAAAIFHDPAVQDRAVAGILQKAAELGVAGIQIDFENLRPSDRDVYTAFLRRLKHDLEPKGLTLSVAVAAKTYDSTDGWGGASDYAAIGQVADLVYIMAYDLHWVGGPPGPVAAYDWTEAVTRYAVGVMPAQKILLGVPYYGYDWAVKPTAETKNRAFGSDRMAIRMAELGAVIAWDEAAMENKAVYRTADGEERIAYYPDQLSLERKMRLAYQYNLKGIAVWRVGFESAPAWASMSNFKESPHK